MCDARSRDRAHREAAPERDRADHYAAAVYGSIVAAALIEAFRGRARARRGHRALVLTTMAVFWLAHVWSGIVGDRIHHGPQLQVGRLVAIAGRSGRSSRPPSRPSPSWCSAGPASSPTRPPRDSRSFLCVVQLFA